MFKAFVGDLTKLDFEVDVIVNAANGVGVMGAGVAGAIRREGGVEIQEEAKKAAKKNKKLFDEGQFYITTAGKLKAKKVFHAVTMQRPGCLSSNQAVTSVMHNMLRHCLIKKVNSIIIPGLGIGIGNLDKKDVARIMGTACQNYSPFLDIYIVDLDEEFVNEVMKYTSSSSEEENHEQGT